MKTDLLRKIILAAGVILIVVGVGIMGWNTMQDRQAGEQSEEALTALDRTIPQGGSSEPIGGEGRDPSAAVGEHEEAAPAELAEDPESGILSVENDGRYYMGYLTIPRIQLRLPVQSSWSYPKLKISPCRYRGTTEDGDLIVIAHNYESHFGKLKYLSPGDHVMFTDVSGGVWQYEVLEIETIQPTAIDKMISGDWDMTLFTCTIGGKARVTVRCGLLSAPESQNGDRNGEKNEA